MSGARQTALDRAKGQWITSIDPDDLIDKDYFRYIFEFLKKYQSDDINLIVTNLISLNSSNGRLTNNHALHHRFDRGDRVADLASEPQNIQLGASALLKLDLIREFSLSYDTLIRPTFEDAHLIGRYLSHFSHPKVGILASAKYYYRKRGDTSSLVQSSWSSVDRYTTVLERGYLDLLRYAQETTGIVPPWIQNMVLYDLFWYFLEDSKQFSRTAWVDVATRDRFLELLDLIFAHIDIDVLTEFNIFPVPLHVRHAIITRFKSTKQTLVSQSKKADGTLDLIVFSAYGVAESINIPAENRTLHSFFGVKFCREIHFRNVKPDEFLSILSLVSFQDFPGEADYESGVSYFRPTRGLTTDRRKGTQVFALFFAKLVRARELLRLRTLATGQSSYTTYKRAFMSGCSEIKASAI
ncbi:glycosyltransferase [Glutamicibacter halophytocola]|uniref:glycosyltransferase n=1 Tax=Glutamicibacter halophytocola TaxID=1933880 RepID=UPI003218F775